jgi:pimeloyl-ACP methyl ester carboxylesterase
MVRACRAAKGPGDIYAQSRHSQSVGEHVLSFRSRRPGAAGGPELYIHKDRFQETFCADAPTDVAEVMAVTQRPVAGAALQEEATAAGWKTIPSWYLISEQDNAISPQAQRFMAERMNATIETINGSHAAFIAQPRKVAQFIEKAAGVADASHEGRLHHLLDGTWCLA